MKQRNKLIILGAAITLSVWAADNSTAPDWMPGVVTEITKGHATETGLDYTDYTVRTEDKLFVMRPYPAAQKESKLAAAFGTVTNWPVWRRPQAPVTIPAVVVGDKVDIVPWGDQAFLVRYRNRQYVCAAVRQVLLQKP